MGSAIASAKSSVRYSFENAIQGWQAQDYEDSMACERVGRSEERSKEGRYSLRMVMDLVGGDSHKSKGEAWVNMRENGPKGVKVPANLDKRTITAWVYAPKGARGEPSRPNGFQLFVKDSDWRSEYGAWLNVKEGQWTRISLPVTSSKPSKGWMDKGFDPTRIIALGVKMGAGGGSDAKYKGAVFVDAVEW